jgi:beta-galactosidase
MKLKSLFQPIIVSGMLLVISALQPVLAANNRVVMNLNQTWKFTKGNISGAEAAGFNDNGWSSVGLPHSASIPFFINDNAYVGWVWYRKHFSVDGQYSSRKVFIDFEAAFQHAWVYINGQLVGEHKGGYTGFSYDITSLITFGQDNVCAVKLSNLWDAAIAPRAGDAWFHAGLYRDVSLVITDPLHVARLGTFVTTPQVSASRATVNVKTEVVNQGTASKTCMVVSTVFDPANNKVTSVSTSSTISAGQTYVFSQDTAITNPTLWSPANPKLYQLLTQVYDNGTEVDGYRTMFGVRWYAATAANGFSLNGQRLYLQGFNVHQDRAGWADAAVNYDFYRDLKMLKDAGTNCVRCSHYPHDMAFYEACDKLGILAFAELHFWGRGGFAGGGELNTWYAEAYPTVAAPRAEFDSTLTANFKDMVYEARNHPSIFAWSLGNETDMQMPAAVVTNAKALWTSLYNLSHQLDPSRLLSSGWVGFANDATNPRIVDLLGMNGGNPGTQQSFPVLTTEYGSCVADRPGSYSGCGEPSAAAWRCGALRWLAFHHGTHCQGNGGNWAHMGVCDYHRLPLRQYYWTRNAWLGTPQPVYPAAGTAAKMVITADKTTILNDGTDDCQLIVSVQNAGNQVISNNVNGTLQITSGPGLLPTGTSWTFSTPDGQQAIEMRSYGTGTITVSATSGSLTPGSITITAQDPVPTVGVSSGAARNGVGCGNKIHIVNTTGRTRTVLLDFSQPVAQEKITVRLFDLSGCLVTTLFDGRLFTRRLTLPLNKPEMGTGGYVVTVSINNKTSVTGSHIFWGINDRF